MNDKLLSAAGEPLVDVVIPIHDPSRPIQRTIDSLLQSGLRVPEELRINVVCHNIDVAEISAAVSEAVRGSVRFLSFLDGEPSPAGPFSFGIEAATAEYVSIMGSDDFLEPGALRAWVEVAMRMGLTAFIPPERHSSGAKVATPPVRPWRSGLLDPVRDRLAYRTAPLGLIKRSVITRLGLTMPSRLRNGSDQLFGLKLWFSGEHLAYGKGLPHYVVGADATSRVTFTIRKAADELRAVDEILSDPWVGSLPPHARRAIIVKSVRVHVFSAALLRCSGDRWTQEDREFIRELLGRALSLSPTYLRALSIADRRLVDALTAANRPLETLERLVNARRRYGHPITVLTRDVRGLFMRDGPLRFMVASKLL